VAETKYGKYILKGTGKNSPAVLEGLQDWSGIQHRMKWEYISRPVMMSEKAHSHDFDEFMCFLGCDPSNAFNFGAEIELSLGEEGEKHIIDAATIVCIPKGLVHTPLNFKKIGKPILFCDIYLSPEYISKQVKK
jgi:hypothetical protein